MKKLLTFSFALTALVFSATAQEKREMKSHDGPRMHQDGRMMKDLNLTDAQKAQLKTSRENLKKQLDALDAQKNTITAAQYEERRKALMESQRTTMQSILTAEQKAKMEAARSRGNDRIQRAGDERGMKAERMQKMKAELNLTDEQAAKMKAQHEAMKAQVDAIKADNSLSDAAKKEKLKALHKSSKEQMKSVLTADQQKKMKEMHKEGKKDRKADKKDWKKDSK